MPDGGDSSVAPYDFDGYLARLDAVAGEPRDCGSIWERLVSGELAVARHFSRRDRSYLLLIPGEPRPTPIFGRTRQVLERVLLGEAPKVVASELGVGTSTITFLMKRSLNWMGVNALPSRAPALLALLVQASRHQLGSPPRAVDVQPESSRHLLLSGMLKTPMLESVLSPAEKSVVCLRLEGRSLVEIAALRHTSKRTVANQLAAASRRLGVSGRSSFVRHLASCARQGFDERDAAPTDERACGAAE